MNNYTCTPLEQSKTLAGILPIESADLYYWCGEVLKIGGYKAMDKDLDVPCWSLGALLNVLPFPNLSKDKLGSDKEGWMVSVYPDNCRYDSCWHDNPIDACVSMITKLKGMDLL